MANGEESESLHRASPHALLLPFPAQGHVIPLMELAKHLCARGVDVTFASQHDIHIKLLRSWKGHSDSWSLHSSIQLRCIPEMLPSESEGASPSNWLKALEHGSFELLRVLESEGRPVSCIVGDFLLGWTSSLARRASIPDWVFCPTNASVLAMYLDLNSVISCGYDPFQSCGSAPIEPSDSQRASHVAEFPLGVTTAVFPIKAPFGKRMYDWMEEVLLECVNRIAEAKLGVLCNTTVALEENVLQVLHSRIRKGESTHHNRFFRMIGPLVTNAAAEHKASRASFWQEERDECMEWLDKQPPASVVYVAFGSLKVLTLPQLHEVLLGLIASSHRFLMVVRPNTVVSESYGMSDIYWEAQDGDVVPLEKALPPGFSSPDQQRLYKIVSWAPQTWVLEHPSVGGFFSHCGWNSTLESLWCGVPILGWPWIMDQVTNCWLLSSVWNVGISLQCNERGEASRNEVESGVRQLMGGAATDKLRAQAREIKDKIREAALHNQEITSLVEEIGSVSRFNP